MKGIFIIIDGLGDLPIAALGGQTPLEAAHTPVMDELASTGLYGLVDPIGHGEIPNTHSGTGMLLGMLPEKSDQLFRGPVEAAGLGLDINRGEVALRANFATIQDNGSGFDVLDRRAGRIAQGTTELAACIDGCDLGDGIRVTLKPTEQHRGVLILSGEGLDGAVSDTDPGDQPLPQPVADCMALSVSAERTAVAVNRLVRLSHERLHDHQINRDRAAAGLKVANGIITRGAGTVSRISNRVSEASFKASVISGCNTVKGLGRLFGFNIVNDSRFTASIDTDVDAKVAVALNQLASRDLAFVHFKAPDICSHDCRPLDKRDFLERLDAAMAPLLSQGIIVAVAADHTTDSNSGYHTADPVPALLRVPGLGGDNCKINFGETACRAGNMPRQHSHRFVERLIDSMLN